MNDLSLSVIIPSHNRPLSTRNAVESVIAQDVPCQIIVVDDASDQADELSRLMGGDPRILLVRRDRNGGAGAARNTGLVHACGNIVTFLDSDDTLMPGTLAARLEKAASIGFGNLDSWIIHACGWQEVGARNRQRYPRPTATARDFFSACWFAPGSAILTRTDIFRSEIGCFDEQLRRLEDYDLFARLAATGRLSLVSQPVLGVMVDVNYTAKNDEVLHAATKLEHKMKVMHEKRVIGTEDVSLAKAYLSYERAVAYSRSGRLGRALVALGRSFIHKPRLTLFTGPGWDRQPSAQ